MKNFNFFAFYLLKSVPGVERVVFYKTYVVLSVPFDKLHFTLLFLLKNQQLRFELLLDIWAVDFPGRAKRFQVNYLLASLVTQERIIVRTIVAENDGLESVTSLFASAGWLEREVWDMFGVIFFKNSDLRRILTDYGFDGHPLRKDFPLSGFSEVRYDDESKRIVYEALEISQEYRFFQFKSPWTNL